MIDAFTETAFPVLEAGEPAPTRGLRILEDTSAWTRMSSACDEIAWRAGAFYLSTAWLEPWWETYGKGRLELYLYEKADQPIAFAPLRRFTRRWYGLPVRQVGNLFNAHACRSDVALAESETECIGSFLDALGRQAWDVLFLREIPLRSRLLVVLPALCRERGLRIGMRPSLDSPFVRVNGGWKDYLATRTRRLRKSLNHRRNRLSASRLKPTYRLLAAPDEIEAVLPEVMSLALRSWSGRRGSSIASGRHRGFYETVVRRMAELDCLRLWTLRLSGALAAFEIHIAWGRTLSCVKSCYDPRWARLSPGALLEARVMQWVFESGGFDRYDLLGKDEPYKMRWTEDVERHVEVLVFNRGALARTLETLELRLRPKAGALKRWLLRHASRGGEK